MQDARFSKKLESRLHRLIKRQVSVRQHLNFFKKFSERYKNPLHWLARPAFFILRCFGLWFHKGKLILLALLGFLTSWLWLPKPRKEIPFISQWIEKEIEWLKKPMDIHKAREISIGGISMIIFTLALWKHSFILAVMYILFLSLSKIVW